MGRAATCARNGVFSNDVRAASRGDPVAMKLMVLLLWETSLLAVQYVQVAGCLHVFCCFIVRSNCVAACFVLLSSGFWRANAEDRLGLSSSGFASTNETARRRNALFILSVLIGQANQLSRCCQS